VKTGKPKSGQRQKAAGWPKNTNIEVSFESDWQKRNGTGGKYRQREKKKKKQDNLKSPPHTLAPYGSKNKREQKKGHDQWKTGRAGKRIRNERDPIGGNKKQNWKTSGLDRGSPGAASEAQENKSR